MIMMEIVASNVIASRLPEQRLTAMPSASANLRDVMTADSIRRILGIYV